jgi:hypothetical protein
VIEETLFEAGEPAVAASDEAQSPPEDWFADPELDLADVFDPPAPGDLMTDMPPTDAPPAIDEADMTEPDLSVPDTAESLHEAAEPDLRADGSPVDMDETEAVAAPEVADESSPGAASYGPPPPPIAPAEGEDRSVAVRELSGLFDDMPVRPKRPTIRRVEPNGDGVTKRRVEDDEQVTKSLISRLIEGVKGL